MSERFHTLGPVTVLTGPPMSRQAFERILDLLLVRRHPSAKRLGSWRRLDDESWECEWEEATPEWQ